MPSRVVIVGASAAGLTAAETLRERGYDGALTLIGDETHPPYDRPPLSKQVLAGSWDPQRVMLRDENALGALNAELLLGCAAVGLDTAQRRVLLDGGAMVGYDALIIATGATPRRLPGTGLSGVYVLRTLDDALALRARLLERPRMVVVGAGFLGAEVAAVGRQAGLAVTLVDPLPVPMRRQFGHRIGGLIGRLHREHGVVVRCGVGASRLVHSAGHVTGVELADRSVLDADLVVIAVGTTPATDWLAGSGVSLDNGIHCDARCQAAPNIYAAGDVASWHNTHFGARMRVEHRLNATEQAIAAAGNLLGDDRPFAPVPYFWTDQYDTKIQAHGIFPHDADIQILHGDPDDRRFVAAYGHHGTVVGVLGWNSPRALRTLRQLVVDHAAWPAPTATTVLGAAGARPARRTS
jgi:NADPH-dependent 2,4-dienoyl-CoA reductase/sulfur reductase-like enzyme